MRYRWTHASCDACFEKLAPGVEPIRFDEKWVMLEVCCWCGQETRSGIYRTLNPVGVPCRGIRGHSITEGEPDELPPGIRDG